MARILADATGEIVETIDSPQNVGALGAALLSAVGMGWVESLVDAGELVPVQRCYEPDPEARGIYDERFEVFKSLYARNKGLFGALNAPPRPAARSPAPPGFIQPGLNPTAAPGRAERSA